MNGMIFRSSENGIAPKRTQIPSIPSIPIPEQSQKNAPLVKFNSVLATFKNENLRIFFVKFCKRSWTKQRYLPKLKQTKKADYKVWVTIFSNVILWFRRFRQRLLLVILYRFISLIIGVLRSAQCSDDVKRSPANIPIVYRSAPTTLRGRQ